MKAARRHDLALAATLALVGGAATSLEPRIAAALALAAFGGAFVLALMASPRASFVAWLGAICVVPHWLMVEAGVAVPPSTLAAILVLPIAWLKRRHLRWTAGDSFVAAFVLACCASYALNQPPASYVTNLLLQGLLSYVLIRIILPQAGARWTINALAIACTGIATWAIAEAASGVHPFVGLAPGSPEAFWSDLQSRGGMIRSEGAFGHAISMGAAIAMGGPLLLASTFTTRVKVIGLVLLTLGVLATGSRGPAGALAIGIVLAVVLLRVGVKPRTRMIVLTLTCVIGIPSYVALSSRVERSGIEASSSAEYRERLYTNILQDAKPLSVADRVQFTPRGVTYLGQRSVDSAIINTVLIFGWVPTAIVGSGLVLLIRRALARRANVGELALIAQLPVIASVALITQLYALTFILIGLGVGLRSQRE